MGTARTGHGADAHAAWRFTGWRDGGLPRRRFRDQYHHAADGVFPAHSDLRAALEEGLRYRVVDGDHDPVLDLDHDFRPRADDLLGLPGDRPRAWGIGGIHPAGRSQLNKEKPGSCEPGFLIGAEKQKVSLPERNLRPAFLQKRYAEHALQLPDLQTWN